MTELIQYLPHVSGGVAALACYYAYRLSRFVTLLEARIENLESNIDSNKEDDEERDDRLRSEFDMKLEHQKNLHEAALKTRDVKLDSIQNELTEFKNKTSENFKLSFKKSDDIRNLINGKH